MKGFFERNSSLIFAAISTVGLIATTVTAVRATPKALKLVYEAMPDENLDEFTMKDALKACWKEYIPSMVLGGATIACIFGSAAVNKKQIAALAGAYALTDKVYREYREKVKDELGEDTDVQIRKALAEDNRENYHPSESEDPALFYDPRLGYFESYIDFVTLDDGLECFLIDVPPIRENRN